MIVLSGLLKGCRCLLEVNPLIAKSLDNFTSKIVLFGQQHSGRNNAPPPQIQQEPNQIYRAPVQFCLEPHKIYGLGTALEDTT